MPSLPFLGLLVCLHLLSGIISATETGMLAANKIRLRHLAQRHRYAQVAFRLVMHPDRLIATLLVLNNLANITVAALGTAVCVKVWGPEWGVVWSTAIFTTTLLLFGEITPKIFAARYADQVALVMAPVMVAVIQLTTPLVAVFSAVSHGALRLAGLHRQKRSPLVTAEELLSLIELGEEEGILGTEERKLLQRIFEFGKTQVQDVMIPREQMTCVPVTARPEEMLSLVIEEGHSRIPVYRHNVDEIVGVVYTRDLLNLLTNRQLIVMEDLLYQPLLVTPNVRVIDLLREFQRQHVQIAVVYDESRQRTLGLATLEDLLEEIVGDLQEAPRPRAIPPPA